MYRSIIFVTAFHFYHGIPVELADETLAGSFSVGLVTATLCAPFLRCNIMEDILPCLLTGCCLTLSSTVHIDEIRILPCYRFDMVTHLLH